MATDRPIIFSAPMVIAEANGWRARALKAEERLAALSQPQHGGLVEAVRKAAKNASPDRGEVRLHASDWMRVMDALNSPVVGEDACTCQRHPTHCANDCPQHGLSEPTYTAGERVDVPPTPTDTADTPPASGLVDALRRMADTGEHGEKALDGKSCRRLAREALAALSQPQHGGLIEACRKAHDTLIGLNPSNYTHDDVCEANDAAVEAILILADALGERHGKTEQMAELNRARAEGKAAIR